MMGALGSWAHEQSAASAANKDEQARLSFMRVLRDTQDPRTGLRFGEKDRWVESVLLLVAGEQGPSPSPKQRQLLTRHAGSDTTSVTISAVIHHLVHHLSAHRRAAAEVRAAFSDPVGIQPGKKLDACTFLSSCVKESLRLAPAVANFLPRLVGGGGAVVDGVVVADGWTVGASVYALHRNRQYFEQPEAYRPERWLNQQGNQAPEQAFFPFSTGPRMCVGAKLAWVEVTTAVAKTLWVYDMRLAPESVCCSSSRGGYGSCEFRLKSFATSIVDGPVVQFRGREPTLY